VTGEQDALRVTRATTDRAAPADIGVQALRQAAARAAELRRPNPRFRTRDLIGFLLSHGARSRRATQPLARPRVKVASPDGRIAVRIAFI
jgi:hypothetical protein